MGQDIANRHILWIGLIVNAQLRQILPSDKDYVAR